MVAPPPLAQVRGPRLEPALRFGGREGEGGRGPGALDHHRRGDRSAPPGCERIEAGQAGGGIRAAERVAGPRQIDHPRGRRGNPARRLRVRRRHETPILAQLEHHLLEARFPQAQDERHPVTVGGEVLDLGAARQECARPLEQAGELPLVELPRVVRRRVDRDPIRAPSERREGRAVAGGDLRREVHGARRQPGARDVPERRTQGLEMGEIALMKRGAVRGRISQRRVSREASPASVRLVEMPLHQGLGIDLYEAARGQPDPTEQHGHVLGEPPSEAGHDPDPASVAPEPRAGRRVQGVPAEGFAPGARGRGHRMINDHLAEHQEVGHRTTDRSARGQSCATRWPPPGTRARSRTPTPPPPAGSSRTGRGSTAPPPGAGPGPTR